MSLFSRLGIGAQWALALLGFDVSEGGTVWDGPVRNTLSDIEKYTLASLAPFMRLNFKTVKSGYREYETADCITTYLIFSLDDRVLFYGIDTPKKQYLIPMMSDISPAKEDPVEDASLTSDLDKSVSDMLFRKDAMYSLFEPSLFAKKGVLSDADFNEIIQSDTDDLIEEVLDAIAPGEEEEDADFFLRNAMWLLNPVIH